jgi:hypothetical protein
MPYGFKYFDAEEAARWRPHIGETIYHATRGPATLDGVSSKPYMGIDLHVTTPAGVRDIWPSETARKGKQ